MEQKNGTSFGIKRYGVVATAVLVCGFLLLPKNSGTRLTLVDSNANLKLPDYLVRVETTDPEYNEHSYLLTSKLVIGDPGKGNMIKEKVELVRFDKPHFVFRTYGGEGKSSQCGYWWTLNPPKGNRSTFFDHFAICPEWNDATYIVRCRVPEGYISVVGIGQDVECPESHGHLFPDPDILQLNGDICTAATEKQDHLACEYCKSDQFDFELSSCSNNDLDYIDGFRFNNSHNAP
jgi:hypothetical protein